MSDNPFTFMFFDPESQQFLQAQLRLSHARLEVAMSLLEVCLWSIGGRTGQAAGACRAVAIGLSLPFSAGGLAQCRSPRMLPSRRVEISKKVFCPSDIWVWVKMKPPGDPRF